MKRTDYYIDKKSLGAYLAVAFMLLSAVIRVVYFWGREVSTDVFLIHFINVVLAAVIFAFAVIAFGERLPQLTVISVFMGVVFFVYKAFSFESVIHTFLCIILYLLILALYSFTLFGFISTKKLLYPLFALPLLYHIFVEDMQIYVLASPKPPYIEWLPEISVLCIMAALLSLSFSIKKRADVC